jgi:hypothetical protein
MFTSGDDVLTCVKLIDEFSIRVLHWPPATGGDKMLQGTICTTTCPTRVPITIGQTMD